MTSRSAPYSKESNTAHTARIPGSRLRARHTRALKKANSNLYNTFWQIKGARNINPEECVRCQRYEAKTDKQTFLDVLDLNGIYPGIESMLPIPNWRLRYVKDIKLHDLFAQAGLWDSDGSWKDESIITANAEFRSQLSDRVVAKFDADDYSYGFNENGEFFSSNRKVSCGTDRYYGSSTAPQGSSLWGGIVPCHLRHVKDVDSPIVLLNIRYYDPEEPLASPNHYSVFDGLHRARARLNSNKPLRYVELRVHLSLTNEFPPYVSRAINLN